MILAVFDNDTNFCFMLSGLNIDWFPHQLSGNVFRGSSCNRVIRRFPFVVTSSYPSRPHLRDVKRTAYDAFKQTKEGQ